MSRHVPPGHPARLMLLAVLVFLVAGTTAQAAPPVITSLSATGLMRSGRLVLQGSGFGDEQGTGRVEIAGLSAIVTRWSDLRIVAYVPEAAPLGAANVAVAIGGVRSNALALDVLARVAVGRVQWRFAVDSDDIDQRPAVGPDGTIVVTDSSGFVYALTPDGGLKWARRVGGVSGPPAVGPDGTIFVATGWIVRGLGPDGTPLWSFEDVDSSGVLAGPSVGPDGNVYVVDELFGLGALSLSPTGRLLWTHPGVPRFTEYGEMGAEIVFSPPSGANPTPQLYFGLDEYSVSAATIFAFGLDGGQKWARQAGNSNDTFMQRQQQLAVGPGGTIYVTSLSSASGWGLRALEPVTGATLWTYYPWPANGMSPPDVGVDGSIYLSRSLVYLDAVKPDGSVRWTVSDDRIVDQPVVNKAGTLVVTGARNFGEPGFVRGYAATNGAIRWAVPLGVENGGNQVMQTRARFSNDDRTVYAGTSVLGGSPDDSFSFLYAIKATEASAAPGEAGLSAPMTVRPGPGSSLLVDFGAACNATDHAIYWSAGPRPIAWAGSACGLGAGPSATFDPGTPPVGSVISFVVVGRNASFEGSYGRSVTGVEWSRASGLSCDKPQILATSCAP